MSFLLVSFQYGPYLGIECRIALAQPLLQVFVHSRLGNAEVSCGGPDGSAGFDDVHSKSAGSFFYGLRHGFPSDAVCCQKILCAGMAEYVFQNILKIHSIFTGLLEDLRI